MPACKEILSLSRARMIRPSRCFHEKHANTNRQFIMGHNTQQEAEKHYKEGCKFKKSTWKKQNRATDCFHTQCMDKHTGKKKTYASKSSQRLCLKCQDLLLLQFYIISTLDCTNAMRTHSSITSKHAFNKTYQMKSWQWEQNVGWRKKCDMNLCSLTCTILRRRAFRRWFFRGRATKRLPSPAIAPPPEVKTKATNPTAVRDRKRDCTALWLSLFQQHYKYIKYQILIDRVQLENDTNRTWLQGIAVYFKVFWTWSTRDMHCMEMRPLLLECTSKDSHTTQTAMNHLTISIPVHSLDVAMDPATWFEIDLREKKTQDGKDRLKNCNWVFKIVPLTITWEQKPEKWKNEQLLFSDSRNHYSTYHYRSL